MTAQLQQENDSITLAMDIGQPRPQWDERVLKSLGIRSCQTDLTVGKRISGEADLVNAPMFGVYAVK